MKEQTVQTAKKRSGSNVLSRLFQAFKDGSVFTRLSFLIMGFGQIARGQIAKGILYMLAQAAFWLYMLFFGGRYIFHLFSWNLGTKLSG